MQPTSDFTLVTQPAQLDSLIEHLAAEPIIAVDTESNSLHAYRERVCLVQFSTPHADYLVDPLALPDLSPLAPIFADPAIEKVFHAAEYDLLTLQRDFAFSFANLFDTMQAARIVGRQAVGLGSLLAAEFDVHLKKKYQRANWGRRPLPPEMLSYARLDTHYLLPLRHRLFKDLQRAERWPIAQEDFARLCQVNGSIPSPPKTDIWRINGVYDLSPQQVAVLQELANYRQRKADSTNLPLFKIIGDKTLLAIAAALPETLDELRGVHGMSERQVQRHGKRLLLAVCRGLAARPLHPPRRPRLPDDFIERLDALRTWRKRQARRMGVESDVVLPRVLMEEIAQRNPADQRKLAAIMRSTPWRFQHYGAQIQQVLKQ